MAWNTYAHDESDFDDTDWHLNACDRHAAAFAWIDEPRS
jgi:hypothetical protein